jgi:hypothetical protein
MCTPNTLEAYNEKTSFVNVYPNPSSDDLHISLRDDRMVDIDIVDLYGNNLYSIKQHSGHLQIHIDHWPKGVYAIRVSSKMGQQVLKVVIE